MTRARWEEEISSDGRTYYYNPVTGESRWTMPGVEKSEAESWKILKDGEGHTYYYNAKTKVTTWKRPDEYTKEIEKKQEIETYRTDFFKMLSSSVPKELNPIQQSTPAIYTIKEASTRFDADSRLIYVPEKCRDRFLDEWLILERKRRVELERKMVARAMERIKERLFELVDQDLFTIDTQWDDMIERFKLDKDWRILLNYDRLQVFIQVKRTVYNEFFLRKNMEREIKLKTEAKRRIKFIHALNNLLDNSNKSLLNTSYKDWQMEIENLEEYQEMQQNVTGSTAVDLFYDLVEERISHLERQALSITLLDEDTNYDIFISHHKDKIANFSEEEKLFIYNMAKRNWIMQKASQSVESTTKQDSLLNLMKNTPSLSSCPTYEGVKTIIGKTPEFNQIDNEDKRKEIYNIFVEWSKRRNCEPGEIIKGDPDWIDIKPLIDSRFGQSESI